MIAPLLVHKFHQLRRPDAQLDGEFSLRVHKAGRSTFFSANMRRTTLTCDDGKDNEYTDFPLETITLYFANDMIHLPNEY